MSEKCDLNLLYTLSILLEESSVTAAARRLNVSGATISRTLTRIRTTFNDPILVQTGRQMVLTPRALELQPLVQNILSNTQELMRHDELTNLATLTPSFTIRSNDAAMAVFADTILAALRVECPGCHLRFAPESDGDDSEALRQGTIDLYLGATHELRPEIRRQNLLNIRFRGVVRENHPLLDAPITAEALTHFDHISVSRRGRRSGPIDTVMMDSFGLKRNVTLVVSSYFPALHGLPGTDMILAAPDIIFDKRYLPPHGLVLFDFPFALPAVQLFQAWHPRYDADPLRRWLRRTVAKVTRAHGERAASI